MIHRLLQSVHRVGPAIVVDRRNKEHSQYAKAKQLPLAVKRFVCVLHSKGIGIIIISTQTRKFHQLLEKSLISEDSRKIQGETRGT